ncbi:SDR family oxidoreductase [Parathalassolituus penaei]|uniref:SDR family oxidoreductase n=1 Tax=Parathalassolituus penaei TaxID=2997323 RepID=A0A9X3EG96_9GAMM|nr:SDR family oxidoreductase [Parathalassolituus penaei]MCY0966190.1 SDR family oxidoreductase [Parathalassolituus penaei]
MHTPNILIAGASRGIGLGLVETWLIKGARVRALIRSPNATLLQLHDRFHTQLSLIEADMTADDCIHKVLADLGDEQLDMLVLNAGQYGPAAQDVLTTSSTEVADLFMTNAIAPMRLARALQDRVLSSGVIAFMSSQMASVELALARDMPLYGASKAALNSLIRSWSHSADAPKASLLALHPGWVKTDMGGEQAPVEIADSVNGLIQVMEKQAGRGGCYFRSYDQQVLAW